jgi:hypothetical protein
MAQKITPITPAVEFKTETGAKVARIEVAHIGFAKFSALGMEALSRQVKGQKFETTFRNIRIIEQVTLYGDDNTSARLTPETLHKLPRPVAMQIIESLGADDGKAGKIISQGDGINTPILYELGTPVIGADGKEITELEFIAKTYGDIENVLSETQPLDQALALVTWNAKPPEMLQLPSWAVDQITLADGITIATEILPAFVE